MNYIATFYSHFGAIRFKKEMEATGGEAVLMPVPRTLSSSCGTCCSFVCKEPVMPSHPDEVEQIVECLEGGQYKTVFTTIDD